MPLNELLALTFTIPVKATVTTNDRAFAANAVMPQAIASSSNSSIMPYVSTKTMLFMYPQSVANLLRDGSTIFFICLSDNTDNWRFLRNGFGDLFVNDIYDFGLLNHDSESMFEVALIFFNLCNVLVIIVRNVILGLFNSFLPFWFTLTSSLIGQRHSHC